MPRPRVIQKSENHKQYNKGKAPKDTPMPLSLPLPLSLSTGLWKTRDSESIGRIILAGLVGSKVSGAFGMKQAMIFLLSPEGTRLHAWMGLQGENLRQIDWPFATNSPYETQDSTERSAASWDPFLNALHEAQAKGLSGSWNGIPGREFRVSSPGENPQFILNHVLSTQKGCVVSPGDLGGDLGSELDSDLSGDLAGDLDCDLETDLDSENPSQLCPKEGHFLFLPMKGLESCLGILAIDLGTDEESSAEQRAGLEWWCGLGTAALERSLISIDTDTAVRSLNYFHELIGRVVTLGNLPDILSHAARLVAEAVNASWVTIWRMDPESQRFDTAVEFRKETPENASDLAEGLEAAAQKVADMEASRTILDLAAEAGDRNPSAKPVPCVMEPLLAHGFILGVIGVTLPQGRTEFSHEDKTWIRTQASLLALVTRMAKLQDFIRCSEEKLRETENRLRRNEKLVAVGELSTRLAHEVRSPLAAIGGLARRIAKSLAAEDTNRDQANLIVKEAVRLEGMLSDFLDMSRVSQSQKTVIDLNNIIRDALELTRGDLMESGIIIEENYAPNLPKVLLDTDRIKQVLVNVLNNARESTEEGDTIRLDTYMSEEKVLVEIANTGERMAGEILERLFVPFTSGHPQGHGLGLAISQQIIKDHGGEILVRSDDTWSVIFTLAFPIALNRDRRGRNRRSGRDRREAA
ncbi:MAG: GHKL domain-containing protein [Candidatus Eisenbacteria bacterium]|uniref:histidine kinase n=1 Tax=Eiseniibacteriota bacterium TaxID=2212470 RepID=A0A948W891_UNCEI|nr:GHKL domain-containing protein [Candidatus Eisenbacteria bacterium]MBU1947363.1 GHKL domain-containing protein [Candidatus Eisenbacteria bacterium]MBU2692456.1 GHKL domain-containing protein [Candidatus Eisenbacteria bacterium]